MSIDSALKRDCEVAVSENATTTKESLEVGNAAKLREALDDIIELINKWRTDNVMEHWQYSQLFDIADAALAAPPRNCDRFKTKEEAATAFANEKKQWIPQQVLWELAPWLDWLFAPANESEAHQ